MKTEILTAKQKWNRAHRAENAAYRRKHRAANLESERAKSAAYYRAKRETLYPQKMLKAAQSRAKLKGLPCTITIEWIEAKYRLGRCELSGLPYVLNRRRGGGPFSPSIDRVDSTRGYTPENCRLILWALNAAFSHWGESQAVEIWEAFLLRRTQHECVAQGG